MFTVGDGATARTTAANEENEEAFISQRTQGT